MSAPTLETPAQKSAAEEIGYRIEATNAAGEMTPAVAAAWHGYLAAAVEWGVISVSGCDALRATLPEVEGAAQAVLVGR